MENQSKGLPFPPISPFVSLPSLSSNGAGLPAGAHVLMHRVVEGILPVSFLTTLLSWVQTLFRKCQSMSYSFMSNREETRRNDIISELNYKYILVAKDKAHLTSQSLYFNGTSHICFHRAF